MAGLTACNFEAEGGAGEKLECWSCEWGTANSAGTSYGTTDDDLVAKVSGVWTGRFEGDGSAEPIDVTLVIEPVAETDTLYRNPVVVSGTGTCSIPQDHGCSGLSVAAAVHVTTLPPQFGFEAQRIDLWGSRAGVDMLSSADALAGTIPEGAITVAQPTDNATTGVGVVFVLGTNGSLWMQLTPNDAEGHGPVVRIGQKVEG